MITAFFHPYKTIFSFGILICGKCTCKKSACFAFFTKIPQQCPNEPGANLCVFHQCEHCGDEVDQLATHGLSCK